MAFGDTAQDATLFHMVGLSVAINPNNALQAICATEGWRAFREDDLTQLDDIMEWLKGELTDTS